MPRCPCSSGFFPVCSINISTEFLLQQGLSNPALRQLSSFARRGVLEFTERSPMLCAKAVLRKMELLREAGFRLALDHVGAGYNHLLGMINIHPQRVKADRTLCAGVAKDPFRAEAVHSIIQLARKMHAVVVAEGVEKQEDVEALGFMNVGMIQGFIFHVPEAAEAVLVRLAARRERSCEYATTGWKNGRPRGAAGRRPACPCERPGSLRG
jgi:EAL domain-containing protein (putative c-di-GMP-specific phosphodiesterase class I)